MVPSVKNGLNKDLTRKSLDCSVLKERPSNNAFSDSGCELQTLHVKSNADEINSIEPTLQEIAEKYNLNFSGDDSNPVSIVSSKKSTRSIAPSRERPKDSSHMIGNSNCRSLSSRPNSSSTDFKLKAKISNNGPSNYSKLFRIPVSN